MLWPTNLKFTEFGGRQTSTAVSYSEVPGSSLGPETGHPEGFQCFYSVLPGKCLCSTFKWTTAASYYIISNPLFNNQPIIQRCAVRAIESIVK
jgi:hypothetical protein